MTDDQSSRVASLSTDDTAQSPADNGAASSPPNEYEAIALQKLQRNVPRQKTVDALVDAGMIRADAEALTKRIWDENPQERRNNAYILLGAAAICMLIALGLFAMRLLNDDPLQLISLPTLLLLLGGSLGYQAIAVLRRLSKADSKRTK